MTELGADVAILSGLVGAVAVGVGAYQFGHYERVRHRSMALCRTSWFGPAVAVPPVVAGLGVADFFLAELSIPGLGLLFPAIWPVAGVGLFAYAHVETYAAGEAIRHHPDVTAFDDDTVDTDEGLVYRKNGYYRAWWTLLKRHHPHAVTASLAAFPFLSIGALVLLLSPRAGVRLAGAASFSLALYDLVLLGLVGGGTYRTADDDEAAQVDQFVARRDAELENPGNVRNVREADEIWSRK
ncbi:hypothetical protein [Halorussus lipolyticus]|uniref:hypothetical protein n=1 Tax=Halorussus lipolyticus TaxID=3034024 RepID=UPI0023E7A971|nr:hypothetical protein [Halorussus sp. DT80]